MDGLPVLLHIVAADPATSPDLALRLDGYAARSRTGGTALRITLAGRAKLDPGLHAELVASGRSGILQALLCRPGTTAADAVTLLNAERRGALLRHACDLVPDPTGLLAISALRQDPSLTVAAFTLTNGATSAEARNDAARRIAISRKPLTPELVSSLLDHALAAGTAAELAALALGELAERLQACQGAASAPPCAAPRWGTPRDAASALTDRAGSEDERQRAEAYLNSRMSNYGARRNQVTALIGSDVDLATVLARESSRPRVLRAALANPDLTAPILDQLAKRLAREDYEIDTEIMLRVHLAVHPNATLDLRSDAAAKVRRLIVKQARLYPSLPENQWWSAAVTGLADAGAAAATGDPGTVGRALPMSALEILAHGLIPAGVHQLVRAALAGAELEDETTVEALIGLAEDFTGTLGEVLAIVAAVGH